MGRQMSKRRRVYSPGPNKLLCVDVFARKYVRYLLPALAKIRKNINSSDGNPICELQKVVRFKVDMAMALSASDEFAWSHALRRKLEKINFSAAQIFRNVSLHQPLLSLKLTFMNVSRFDQNTLMLPLKFSQNPKCKKLWIKKGKGSRTEELLLGPVTRRECRNETEEKKIENRLTNLRKIIPGGYEMRSVDELLREAGSYITCLELQVKVLQSLVETQ